MQGQRRSLEDVLGEQVAILLRKAGIESIEQLEETSDKELEAIEGIGPKTVKHIRELTE